MRVPSRGRLRRRNPAPAISTSSKPSARAASRPVSRWRSASELALRHPALGGSLEDEIARLIGEPWDAELEPFRRAGAGAPVRWLNATG